MPWIDESKCVKCNICVNKCPVKGAIQVKSNGFPEINNSICTRCGICMDVCPRNAIRPNSENPYLAGRSNFSNRSEDFDKRPGRGMGRGLGRGSGRGMGRGLGRGSGRGMGRNNGGF